MTNSHGKTQQRGGMKNSPKIIQIVTNDTDIFGLGDNGKLYRFHVQAKIWVAMEEEKK